MSDRGAPAWRRWAALLLPIVVVVAMVAQAEVRVRRGREVVLPITGYDPRDLLLGHYITFRYDWNPGRGCDAPPCVYCLQGEPVPGQPVTVQSLSEGDEADCWMRIRDDSESLPTRYYVPEDKATALEGAIREKKASVRLSVSRDGKAVARELLIDGRPWHESLTQSAP